MKALVIHESMFGNTATIASAIAQGLASRLDVVAYEVGVAPVAVPDDVDLLVVGGPTHAFGMSRPSTRRSAAEESGGPLVSAGPGIREWIAGLAKATRHVPVATFDTKVAHPNLPGSAAHAAARRLSHLGYDVVMSDTFFVDGMAGPLVEGEATRGRTFGEDLAALARPRQTTS